MLKPSYFLVSVSNRENLELCTRYGLAGFPSSSSGVWTFCEIRDGDFVSFLYGAKAYNLYQVAKREAISNAKDLPPWKPLTFEASGRTYFFPFRLQLRPIRVFTEPLVRVEFSYVAENLLLRGGYRKTHFQADQTTLQSVSQMGSLFQGPVEQLQMPLYSAFSPSFTRNPKLVKAPEVCRFQETILQTAIRRHLLDPANIASLLKHIDAATPPGETFEALGEKALPQGHVDLLLKQRVPLGSAMKIPIEVKLGRAQPKDVLQLREYVKELSGECPGGILIASEFSRAAVRSVSIGIKLVRYSVQVDMKGTPSFDEIQQSLVLEGFTT